MKASVYWQLLCQTGPILSQICFGNHYTLSILVTAVYWQPLYIGKHCIMETAVYWQALYIGNYSIMSIMATTVYRQLLCQTEPFRPQICTGNYSTIYWQLLCQTGPAQMCNTYTIPIQDSGHLY